MFESSPWYSRPPIEFPLNGLDAPLYLYLLRPLAEKETFGEEREVVRVEEFNQFVGWFGPIKDGSSGSQPLLDRIRTTLAQRYVFGSVVDPSGAINTYTTTTAHKHSLTLSFHTARWFHGDISAEDAEKLLTREGVGSFLVRHSSQPGAFTLSRMSSSGIDSLRILQPTGCGHGFVLDDEHRYPSLLLLVQALQGTRTLVTLFSSPTCNASHVGGSLYSRSLHCGVCSVLGQVLCGWRRRAVGPSLPASSPIPFMCHSSLTRRFPPVVTTA